MAKTKRDIVHDINNEIGALGQSMEILNASPELLSQMLPLLTDKVKELSNDWNLIKEYLKE